MAHNEAQLTLCDSTDSEVLERLPEATIITYLANGQRGDVLVKFVDLDEDEGRALVAFRGFAVAPSNNR